jgi:hypothetical protein
MYGFLSFIELLAFLALCVSGGAWAYSWWKSGHGERVEAATRTHMHAKPTYQNPGYAKAASKSLETTLALLGLPDVQADMRLLNVPSLNPMGKDGWETTQKVLSTSRVVAYFGNGRDELDLLELGGGYVVALGSGAAFLLHSVLLDGPESGLFAQEYDDATSKNDGEIACLFGHSWKITGAAARNPNSGSGEEDNAYMQVLSTSDLLGQPGYVSVLPPVLLTDREHHTINDIRAVSVADLDGTVNELPDSDPGDGKKLILYAFWVGNKWNCLVGRKLTPEEQSKLQAI